MLKKLVCILVFITNLICSESNEEKVIDPKDTELVEAENAYQAALEEMQAKEREKIRNQNLGESYLEKVQKRYVSHMPYVMMTLMIVPIIKKHDVVGYLTIMPEIKGKDVEAYRKIVKELVHIRDAVFCDLFNALNRLWIGPEPPSADIISGRIQNCVANVCKAEVAEKVTLHILNFNLSIQVHSY